MESQRMQRISRELQKELSSIFQKMTKDVNSPVMISVTKTRVSPDLSLAKVYLSIFPTVHAQPAFEEVVKNSPVIMKTLGNNMKQQLRRVPQLTFYLDDSLDYAQNIDDQLKGKDNPLEDI